MALTAQAVPEYYNKYPGSRKWEGRGGGKPSYPCYHVAAQLKYTVKM